MPKESTKGGENFLSALCGKKTICLFRDLVRKIQEKGAMVCKVRRGC